jgi:hypothetical protein
MPATVFLVSFKAKTFAYEGSQMKKLKIKGKARNRVKKMQKWMNAIIVDDPELPPKNATGPKIKIFDSAIEGMDAAVGLISDRLSDVLNIE